MAKKTQAKPQKTQKAKASAPTSAPKIKHMSVGSTWSKVAGSAPWVGGQSSTLSPGSPAAVSRRKYRQTKYKARTKKVIRPRITKHRRQPDKP